MKITYLKGGGPWMQIKNQKARLKINKILWFKKDQHIILGKLAMVINDNWKNYH